MDALLSASAKWPTSKKQEGLRKKICITVIRESCSSFLTTNSLCKCINQWCQNGMLCIFLSQEAAEDFCKMINAGNYILMPVHSQKDKCLNHSSYIFFPRSFSCLLMHATILLYEFVSMIYSSKGTFATNHGDKRDQMLPVLHIFPWREWTTVPLLLALPLPHPGAAMRSVTAWILRQLFFFPPHMHLLRGTETMRDEPRLHVYTIKGARPNKMRD